MCSCAGLFRALLAMYKPGLKLEELTTLPVLLFRQLQLAAQVPRRARHVHAVHVN